MSFPLDSVHATPEDLAMLREEFGPDSTPLGWDAVYAFEGEHGIILPEPYRSFVATIGDGSYSGPPDYGLMELGTLPPDWGSGRPERDLGKPFPLTGQWIWEGGDGPERMKTSSPRFTTTALSCWAPMAAACTGT